MLELCVDGAFDVDAVDVDGVALGGEASRSQIVSMEINLGSDLWVRKGLQHEFSYQQLPYLSCNLSCSAQSWGRLNILGVHLPTIQGP